MTYLVVIFILVNLSIKWYIDDRDFKYNGVYCFLWIQV